jgi:hypothetical protein
VYHQTALFEHSGDAHGQSAVSNSASGRKYLTINQKKNKPTENLDAFGGEE